MGTPQFAVPSLRALAASHDVVAVYTRPDRPSGRGRSAKPSAVKLAALELGVRVEQPPHLDADATARFTELGADVAVIAAFGAILPAEMLEAPRFGTVNVHASLLPRWRGAAPVQRAILAGDETTGITIMRVVARLDAGPFAAQAPVPVDAHSCDSLTHVLAEAAPGPLLDVLDGLEDGSAVWTEQHESTATYAAKVTAAHVALSPRLTVEDAWRRVRASSSSAPARAAIQGRAVTVAQAEPSYTKVPRDGVLATKHELLLGFVDGTLRVLRLTPGGHASMDGASWARGARLATGATWGPLP